MIHQTKKQPVGTAFRMVPAVLLLFSLLLILAGLHGQAGFERSGFSTADIWTRTRELGGEAESLYRDWIAPEMSGISAEDQAGGHAAARRLLAAEWGAGEEELAGYSDGQVWKLLSMTYSYSRKKISSAGRKSLATLPDAEEAGRHMLAALAAGGVPEDAPVLAGVKALKGADFVVVSRRPGTFEEMRSDVHLPERVGVWQPGGDSTPPAAKVCVFCGDGASHRGHIRPECRNPPVPDRPHRPPAAH